MARTAKVLRQVVREFWLPLAIAGAWTAYSLWHKPFTVRAAVNVLGPAFFLVSWMTGQVFRIKKQESVQSGLSSLETRLEGLIGQLTQTALELTSYATGGDSYCYFSIGAHEGGKSSWAAVHEGKYPLYNVHARIVDLDLFHKTNDPLKADRVLTIGDMAPGQAVMLMSMDLGAGEKKDFNVFFSARNGLVTQLIRFRRVNGQWTQAIRVLDRARGAEPILERIDEHYPRDASGAAEGLK